MSGAKDRIKKIAEESKVGIERKEDIEKPKSKRVNQVNLRLNEEEIMLIKKASESRGMSVSTYCRYAIRKDLGLIR